MASSSKPVLGVAAMMLIEEGLLHPTDEVAAYLPQFGEMQVAVRKQPADRDISPWFVTGNQPPEHRLVAAQRAITIHHLLTHTSGLDSYGLGSAAVAVRVPLYADMPLDFQPGTRWGYSPRLGHDVVARVIEIVSGMPYDEFVRTRIFEPLGMTDTHFNLPPEKEARRVVIHGLDAKAKGWVKPTRYVSASGGLSSTAADFLRFEQMLANGGTLFGNRLLSPQSVATMSSNQVGALYPTGAPRLRDRHPHGDCRLKPRDYDFNAIISSRSPERSSVSLRRRCVPGLPPRWCGCSAPRRPRCGAGRGRRRPRRGPAWPGSGRRCGAPGCPRQPGSG